MKRPELLADRMALKNNKAFQELTIMAASIGLRLVPATPQRKETVESVNPIDPENLRKNLEVR